MSRPKWGTRNHPLTGSLLVGESKLEFASLERKTREFSIGIDPYVVFQDVKGAPLIGANPQGSRMESTDLLDINGQIFAKQGKAPSAITSRNVKVIVVSNPCNANAYQVRIS
ncbi:hypothetical protein ACH5RR_029858 [Cinchona calisaya]|uniref:Lactate/malate dehydrogenase N-terminal domain-containing protein n=1 Tax=Cinchona calisaya TaxID=153742 RepID=A0ABD2YW63_9GENT